MSIQRSGDNQNFFGAPPVVKHDAIRVDDVLIDGDRNDVIRISHARGDGNDLIDATDRRTGASNFRVDSNGNVISNGVSVTSELAAATHLDDGASNELVKRNQAAGTQIDNLHCVASTTNYTETYPPAGLFFDRGTCDESLDLVGDGQISYIPYDSNDQQITTRQFLFGRAQPLAGQTMAQTDHKRDGLTFVDETNDHEVQLCVNEDIPTLILAGAKSTTTDGNNFVKPVCPVIDIRNANDDTVFAVYDDGFVRQKGHHSTDPDALASGHYSSMVAGDGSVFVGSSRISYDRAAHKLTLHTLKHQIPAFLQSYNLPANQVPLALDQMTVHGWIALARTFLNNPKLEASDVFPLATTADWDEGSIDQGRPPSPRRLPPGPQR